MISNKVSLASIGDCVIDFYPDQQKVFLGGTAYNVAFHARNAGARASIISAVGTDQFGKRYFEKCKALDINTDRLRAIGGKTSSVFISLDEEGRPVISGWDLGVLEGFTLTDQDEQFLQTRDAARAILLKPLKNLFTSFCQMHLPQTFKAADFAGGSAYSEDIDVIHNYVQDLDMIVRSVDHENQKELAFLKQIAQKYDKLILVTLGAAGSILFTKDREYFEPVVKTNVADTTGAGDAYIAHFLVSYIQTRDIRVAMKEATMAAAKVITQLGSNAKAVDGD